MNEENLEHMGAAVIVVDPQSHKILLGERMNAYKSGYFGLPGGRSELRESVELGAVREVVEETGLRVSTIEYVGVVREFQETYNFVHFGMAAVTFEGILENKEPHKCKEWVWFDADALPDKILPAHKILIDMFLGKIKEKMVDIGHE